MQRIALTGGFCSGKSTVAKMFESLGLKRLDADEVVHQLLSSSEEVWKKIEKIFGTKDRQKLGEIVFKDDEKRKKLEEIVHPKVKEVLEGQIKELELQGVKKVLLEIPLLFEAGWNRANPDDLIIVVEAEHAIQIERAKKKWSLSEAEIEARINAQLPLSEKVKKADFVIHNDGDLEATKAQVKEIFGKCG